MTIRVEGMHCAHCAAVVKQALMEIDGITSIEVDIDRQTARFDGHADEALLREAIDDAGFDFAGVITE